MIEPYTTVLNQFIGHLSKIGYGKLREFDCLTVFSNRKITIEISTEKYYQPNLMTGLIDGNGEKFAISIIRQVSSPDQFSKDCIALEAIKERYRLNEVGIDIDMRDEGNAAYLSLTLEQLLNFLSSYETEILSGAYKPGYAITEKAALKKIGIE